MNTNIARFKLGEMTLMAPLLKGNPALISWNVSASNYDAMGKLLNKNELFRTPGLPINFIDEIKGKLKPKHWHTLTFSQNFTTDDLMKFSDYVDWEVVSGKYPLTLAAAKALKLRLHSKSVIENPNIDYKSYADVLGFIELFGHDFIKNVVNYGIAGHQEFYEESHEAETKVFDLLLEDDGLFDYFTNVRIFGMETYPCRYGFVRTIFDGEKYADTARRILLGGQLIFESVQDIKTQYPYLSEYMINSYLADDTLGVKPRGPVVECPTMVEQVDLIKSPESLKEESIRDAELVINTLKKSPNYETKILVEYVIRLEARVRELEAKKCGCDSSKKALTVMDSSPAYELNEDSASTAAKILSDACDEMEKANQ